MDTPIPLEIAETLKKRCRDFLGEPWTSAEATDIQLERLRSICNSSFVATLTAKTPCSSVPLKVTVHLFDNDLFGGSDTLKYNGEAAEAVVTEMLSQERLAPTVLGVFTGGRIEAHIPGRNMTLEDLNDESLVVELARKIARIHSFHAPISKEANRLDVILDQVNSRTDTVVPEDVPESDSMHYRNLLNFPLSEEIKFTSKILSKVGGEPVFCHNNLTLDNILLRNDVTELERKLMLIDYGLSGYWYRAYDIAYFLNGRKFTAKRSADGGLDLRAAADEKVDRDKLLMSETYLDEWSKLRDGNIGPEDTPKHLQMEVEVAELAVLLFVICSYRLMAKKPKHPLRPEELSSACDEYRTKKALVIAKFLGHLGDLKDHAA